MTGDDRLSTEPRHPLPASEEAREDELPENLVSEKGTGEDSVEAVQPAGKPVGPDGEPYGEPTGRSSVEQPDDA
ncbi:hypothetical protein RCO27_17620 [Sphingosinicella sp. LHD-64]|uniref:hypothetical protein n=1 Tax=Sphingosinicella sp. LHD-64 TaxID=3072139 RepID=UPI00280E4DE0|nr:hypothetical protein [Sphingosinicella sp. LHD-64]MDQ8758049.1 hypothetical protein [Sphingosinicella sp. LHD-64]